MSGAPFKHHSWSSMLHALSTQYHAPPCKRSAHAKPLLLYSAVRICAAPYCALSRCTQINGKTAHVLLQASLSATQPFISRNKNVHTPTAPQYRGQVAHGYWTGNHAPLAYTRAYLHQHQHRFCQTRNLFIHHALACTRTSHFPPQWHPSSWAATSSASLHLPKPPCLSCWHRELSSSSMCTKPSLIS